MKRGLCRRDQRPDPPAGYARDSSSGPGRLPSGWARVSHRPRLAGRPPLRERFARLPLPDRLEPRAEGLRERRRGVSERHLQPARERIHRLRLSSRVRAKRLVLYGARGTRAGQSQDARFHSARIHVERRVATTTSSPEWHATNPAANVFEGTRRELLREAHVVAEPHPSDGRGGVQPDGEAGRSWTTACSTPAAATTDSATAADRTRAQPARRSASTRS